jgi:peptidoglycan/LPS O-acetylase OafA/YrhL
MRRQRGLLTRLLVSASLGILGACLAAFYPNVLGLGAGVVLVAAGMAVGMKAAGSEDQRRPKWPLGLGMLIGVAAALVPIGLFTRVDWAIWVGGTAVLGAVLAGAITAIWPSND